MAALNDKTVTMTIGGRVVHKLSLWQAIKIRVAGKGYGAVIDAVRDEINKKGA